MANPKTRRLVNNFAFLTVGYFFVRLLTMAATLYAARVLGPGDFGALSSGLNIAFVLSVLANLGLDGYLVLAIARNPQESNALLGDSLLVKVIAIPFALLGAFLLKISDPQSGLLFFILIIYGLLHSYLLLLWAVFRGLERMGFQTILMIMQAAIIAIGSITAIWLTQSATVAAVAYLISTILTVTTGYVLLYKKGIRPVFRWQPAVWKQLLKTAFPFGLIFAYLVVYDRLPTILILLLSPKSDAGWYNSVYTIVAVLATIPSIMVTAAFPFIARESQKNQQSVEQISTSLIKYTTIIGLGLAIILFVLAPWLIPFLFGEAYLPSIDVMKVLAMGLPFLFLIITLVNMVEAVGQQQICARYAGYALLLAVPLCAIFVWQWGYLGGAIAYVLNNALLAAMMLRLARKTIGNIRLTQAFFTPTITGLISGFVIYFLQDWPFYMLLPLAVLLYLVLLLLSGAIGLPEVEMARNIWQSRGRSQPAAGTIRPVGNEDSAKKSC